MRAMVRETRLMIGLSRGVVNGGFCRDIFVFRLRALEVNPMQAMTGRSQIYGRALAAYQYRAGK